jgi:DNA-binding SARP family transcriptional activator
MLRLATFGGLTLADPIGNPLVTQRLRLALLALLATAGERGVRRDKLLACLWPESSTEKARHALQQLLYSLRRQIDEEVFLGSDQLRLNPVVMSSDLSEFEAALAAAELDVALGLYRGPFLDGFFLDESTAFEEWAEGERARLAGDYARALSRSAKEAGRQGQHTREIECWRKLSTLDPLSERSALGLIQALVVAGELAEATTYARNFDAMVRRELQAAPATDLTGYIQRVRQAPVRPGESEPADPGERYVLERQLGHGSTATVYLARDLKLDRQVALKLLKPALASSVEAKRFVREIAITAGLHHPHILQVHDSGELPETGQGKRLYYVMPYVEGESLRERLLREIQLPIEDAVRLTREVADALAYAHARGIVHRNIKPENILLQSGHALVADFGIASALALAGGDRLTSSGVILGTPGYMSPEQAVSGRVPDGQSDIYSLGCVLYEMLAGEPPYTGRTPQAILARAATDPVPPLRTVRPDVPAALERTVLQALARAPRDRFATAEEFAESLLPSFA